MFTYRMIEQTPILAAPSVSNQKNIVATAVAAAIIAIDNTTVNGATFVPMLI